MTATDKLELLVPVKGGRLDMTEAQKALVAGYLSRRDGKPVVLRLAKPTNTRTVRANRYYWGPVLGTIAEATGNSTEDLHVAFRDMFLPRRFIRIGEREVEVRKTTTDLTPAEFSRYVQQVVAYAAAELSITIPEAL
jgi:hypothetical protein